MQFNKLRRRSSPYVLAFAMLLVGAPWIPVYAQHPRGITQDDRDIGEINRRLNGFDGLQIEHRLSMVETLIQDLKDQALWNKLTTTGTGLLLGERAIMAIGLRRKEEKED